MGGGAGINFKTNGFVSVYLEAELTKQGIKIKTYEIDLPDSFDALGYDDGMDNVKISLLKCEKLPKEYVIDILKNIKVDPKIIEIIINEKKSLTLAELQNLLGEKEKVTIEINVSGKYENTLFRGYTRPRELSVGFEIFTPDDIVETDDYDYCYINNETNSFYDELYELMPIFTLTQEGVKFYKDVFVNFFDNVFEIAYDLYNEENPDKPIDVKKADIPEEYIEQAIENYKYFIRETYGA